MTLRMLSPTTGESLDTDWDGIGNNTDTDDDNDGVEDLEDAFPLDANESLDTDGVELATTQMRMMIMTAIWMLAREVTMWPLMSVSSSNLYLTPQK